MSRYFTGIPQHVQTQPGTAASMIHPEYMANLGEWQKYRDTLISGKRFVNKYLKRYSKREDGRDFQIRREITYCPAHAKAALMDVKNSIYQRMFDIKRSGGSQTYQDAVKGLKGGVDLTGKSMTGYLGCDVLPELLALGHVGVYVDKGFQDESTSRGNASRPYIYLYRAEDIRSWNVDSENRTTALLLRDCNDVVDEEFDLVIGQKTEYRYLKLLDGKVEVTFYDENGKELDDERNGTLNLNTIPFIPLILSQSLLVDVADYQISLLNLASGDLNYAMKSNYPFYTEQYDPYSELAELRASVGPGADELTVPLNQINVTNLNANDEAGTEVEATKGNVPEVQAGVSQGRRYPKGLERPGFIAPSSEPLKASMEKQDTLRKEIRQLINLSIRNLEPTRATEESKHADDGGLEAGLACIGIELEHAEREISRIWEMYEGGSNTATINYPRQYKVKDDAERREEAKELTDIRKTLPSKTAQKEMTKEIIDILMAHKVKDEDLQKMMKEVEEAEVIEIDPEVLRQDHEAGFVSTETASQARLYPKDEVEKAKKDHAERLARIKAAQSNEANRGDDDNSADPDATKLTKEGERITDEEDTTKDRTRGEGVNNNAD